MAKTGDPARAVTAPATGTLDFALDRGSPVPLYYQLAQQLEAAIERGVLAPGNLLGNEVDLSVRLGPSGRPSSRSSTRGCWSGGAAWAPRWCTARSGARWS